MGTGNAAGQVLVLSSFGFATFRWKINRAIDYTHFPSSDLLVELI